jgi:SAM-dependent methyltransferase
MIGPTKMDDLTQRYYAAFAEEIARIYNAADAPSERSLSRAFAPGMRVLDIGTGSGRDVSLLLDMGCDAYGVEPCREMREASILCYPSLAGRIESGLLPELGQPFGGQFDGVLCSAVLMHLPRAQILDAALAMRAVLRENGRLLLSIPLERPGLDPDNRDKHGRLFTPLNPDYLQLLFERVGFQLLEKWHSPDSLGREGYSWFTLVLQARDLEGVRPLDQIEGILNRDKKTATYKLALFRALCEVAISGFDQVRWVADGVIGVPIEAVSEKWLNYYWPIFESANFIPQIRGEAESCTKPIAFRSSLSRLIREYRTGGLTAFTLDYRGNHIPPHLRGLVQAVLDQIRNTIVRGPVTYSGGALETGRVFSYDATMRTILMSASLWRELSLLGHWIQDAIILRWAELTAEISRREIGPSVVIDLLLTTPIAERDVADARNTYVRLPGKECVWTGQAINKEFHVDHIIPFVLWHNNDLWNLVPALPRVNSLKRDRLPTRNLMIRRRDAIVHYWETLRASCHSRFDYEVCRVLGTAVPPPNWQTTAFSQVADAVELTAIQRGCERWEP